MAIKAHTMCVARDPTTGAVLLSATVNVYTPGTVTPIPATIYDKNGSVLSNPLTSDPSTGLIDFYLTIAQEVDLSVAKAGYTTRTYSNVPVLDDATFELSSLLTNIGDLVSASAANVPARIAGGAINTLLHGMGINTLPAYSGVAYADVLATAFTSWTPAISQGGANPTSTNQGSTYLQIGKLVIVSCNITATSAGAVANDIIISSLPVAPKLTGGFIAYGAFALSRATGAGVHVGSAIAVTATNVKFLSSQGTGGYMGNTNGPSFAVASGDIYSFLMAYEAA